MAVALRAFLIAAKERALATTHTSPLTYVIGNEGGDMDSVVSAIFTALLLTSNTASPDHIPVLNFGSRDLTLRKDIEGILRTVNVTNTELLFVDDMKFSAEKGDRFILVDHNILKPSQRKLWAENDVDIVTGVIDHHRDEEVYTAATILKSCKGQMEAISRSSNPTTTFSPVYGKGGCECIRDLDVVGSAASLVALQWKKAVLAEAEAFASTFGGGECQTKPFEESVTARLVASEAVSVLLAPVVIDTASFKISKGKVTPKDVEAKDFLLRFLQPTELKDFRKSAKKIAAIRDEDDDDTASKKILTIPTSNEEELVWSAYSTAIATTTAAAKLSCVIAPDSPAFIKIGKFYDMLKEWKSDVRSLTVDEHLRRDYKKFTFVTSGAGVDAATPLECGVSTVLLLQEDIDEIFTKSDEWVAGCKSRMKEECYNLHLSTLTSGSKQLQAVFDPTAFPELKAALEEFAVATKDHVMLESTGTREYPELGLVMMHWKQHSDVVSRKNLTPLLADHFAAFYRNRNSKI